MPKHTPQTAPDPRDPNTKDDFAPSTNPRLHPSTPLSSNVEPPSDDWDAGRLERLAKEYVSMRKEIWQGLATRVGEKWIDVEAKCMHSGLKNLQSASLSAARRERRELGHSIHGYDDDSGISGIDLNLFSEDETLHSSESAFSSLLSLSVNGDSASTAPPAGSYRGIYRVPQDTSGVAQGYDQIAYSMDRAGLSGSSARMPVYETNYDRSWTPLNVVDDKAELWKTESYSQDADSNDIHSKDTTKDALPLSSKQGNQLTAQIPSQKLLDLVMNDTAAKNSGHLSDAAMSKEIDEKNQTGQSPPLDQDLGDTIHERAEQRSRHTPDGAQKTRHPISPSLAPPESDSESSSLDEKQELSTHLRPKKLLVDRLMVYFFQIFSRCHSSSLASNSCCLTNEATTISLPPSTSTSQQSQDSRKRKKASDNGDKDEDDTAERGRGKIPSLEDSSVRPKRLACPYFKKDPLHFQTKQSCCGPGWETVHRLKEHLDRNHCLPISCLRCYAPFDTEAERDFHMRSAEQCELRDPPALIEGFNASQRVELKSRPRGLKSMSEPQKWRRVYLILFPGTPEIDIPSPYYEFRTPRDHGHPVDLMMEYEEYLQRELPLRVRQQLEVRVERALDPVEEALRGQLVEIVRDVQLELFQLFRSAIPSVDDQDAHRNPRLNSDTNSNEQSEPRNIDQKEPRPAGQIVDPTFGGLDVSLDSANALAAWRPEPYLDWNLEEFDGQLFDFRELILHTEDSDSAYGTMSSTANLNQKATEET